VVVTIRRGSVDMHGDVGVRKPKCLITASLSEAAIKRLAERVDVIYEDWRKTGRIYLDDELAERIKKEGIEILIVEADQVSGDTIRQTELKFIGACRGNPYAIDLAAATERGIPVVHAPARNSQAVAEFTVGILLALMRKIVFAQRLLDRGIAYEASCDFQRMYSALEGREVQGKVVGIIGLGDIGTRVAKILSSFGASILVYDPYVSDDKIRSVPARRATLDELLSQSDIISIHVKLTEETYHIIGEREISRMKPSSVLINTSAPGTLDDSALLKALREGIIAGAALDVQENEPIDSSNPFLEFDNVVVTPHIAGNSAETIERQSEMIVDDLIRFLDGERPRHLMNPEIYSCNPRTQSLRKAQTTSGNVPHCETAQREPQSHKA